MLMWTEKWSRKTAALNTAAVVRHVVDAAPGYHAGEIECLRAELKKLQDIVSVMAQLLPPEAQRTLVSECCYGWDEVEL